MTTPARYRAARRKTDVAALLLIEDALLKVRIVDISRDGARVKLPGWVAPGTPVFLQIGADKAPALVHWMDGDAAGLRFVERLDAGTLTALETFADPDAGWR